MCNRGFGATQFLEVNVENKTRKGEASAHPFRATRIFHANSAWYYSTRNGEDIGPFPDRRETEASLLEYLRKFATEDQHMGDPDR